MRLCRLVLEPGRFGSGLAALICEPAGALADCCGPSAKGTIKPINVKVVSCSATIRAAPISFLRRISLLIYGVCLVEDCLGGVTGGTTGGTLGELLGLVVRGFGGTGVVRGRLSGV